MQFDGLRANRFLFLTLAGFYIGKNELPLALKIFDDLKGYDPIRVKYYEFRKM